ncbi:MAG TPA: hypothetical protein VGM32_13705 [Rhodopila sp.]|jgi:hypothetical protein
MAPSVRRQRPRCELSENWDEALSRFIKVTLRDYKRAPLDLKAEGAPKATVAAE